MATYTKIEWTKKSWNPVTGCSEISEGCAHCYAKKFAIRLQKMGNPRYKNGFDVTLHPDLLNVPLHWKKPSLIFVNSMSDLFHEEIPLDFIEEIFAVMRNAHWHIFQILTKRSDRLKELAHKLQWTPNIWTGVTVELSDYYQRIYDIEKIAAEIKFLSLEPLLGPMPNLPLKNIQWVIVGGESGFNARPMKAQWVEDIRTQCERANVPFFFKQWGGVRKWENGRKLNGREYNNFPKNNVSLPLL